MGLSGVKWLGNLAYAPARAFTGLTLKSDEWRVADPILVLNIDQVYYIGENSPARNTGSASPHVATDIEGKPRDDQPDIGAFEYSGYPLLRGPLAPVDVGLNASERRAALALDAPGVYVTRLDLIGRVIPNTSAYWGPVTIETDGVTTGKTPVQGRLDVSVDGKAIYNGSGFPATIQINTGELSDGPHRLAVFAEFDPDKDVKELTFAVQNIRVESPEEQAHICGRWPVILSAGISADQIEQVQISVDGQQLHSDNRMPDQLALDTTLLTDGEHVLTARIVFAAGGITQSRTIFVVENHWLLDDQLLPPRNYGIFGVMDQARTSQSSSGWSYATDQPAAFARDAERLVKSVDDTPEYLEWSTPGLTAAEVTIFTRNPDISNIVTLAISTDGVTFTPVIYSTSILGYTAAGWYQCILSAEIPDSLRPTLFRFELRGVAAIQVGRVTLHGRNQQKGGSCLISTPR